MDGAEEADAGEHHPEGGDEDPPPDEGAEDGAAPAAASDGGGSSSSSDDDSDSGSEEEYGAMWDGGVARAELRRKKMEKRAKRQAKMDAQRPVRRQRHERQPRRPVIRENPDAKERDRLLAENMAKWEGLPDDELEAVVPKDAEGKPSSIGTFLHETLQCAACSFFHHSLAGCRIGLRCKYCHGNHPKKKGQGQKKRIRPGREAREARAEARALGKGRFKGKGKGAYEDRGDRYGWNDGERPGKRARYRYVEEEPVPPIDDRGSSRPSWLTGSGGHSRSIFSPADHYGGGFEGGGHPPPGHGHQPPSQGRYHGYPEPGQSPFGPPPGPPGGHYFDPHAPPPHGYYGY